MKKLILSSIIMLMALGAMAQRSLSFPFQGGKDAMNSFFKDSLVVSPDIKQYRATGVAVFKFTADEKGNVTKMIVFYADDASLAAPVAQVLSKSNHKWVIPDGEKHHDFMITVAFNFNTPENQGPELLKETYDYNRNRHPISAINQVPLNMVTLLPMVSVNYDITL